MVLPLVHCRDVGESNLTRTQGVSAVPQTINFSKTRLQKRHRSIQYLSEIRSGSRWRGCDRICDSGLGATANGPYGVLTWVRGLGPCTLATKRVRFRPLQLQGACCRITAYSLCPHGVFIMKKAMATAVTRVASKSVPPDTFVLSPGTRFLGSNVYCRG